MTKSEKALDLFSNNFNCSQAVLTAFAPDFDLDETLALKLGTSSAAVRETVKSAARFRERCLCWA